jgi:hypothetical protein
MKEQYREDFNELLTLSETRGVLGCSASTVLDLIKDGSLTAYHLDRGILSRADVDKIERGLRIAPESVREFLTSAQLR